MWQTTAPLLDRASLSLPESPLFGTDGIRGKVGDLLTLNLARQIGFWAGQTLSAQAVSPGPVILGQDSRCSSPSLAASLAAGLNAAGLEVWDVGLCPTPAVAYLIQTTGAIGGAMISASHNPPADNGIKFFSQDGSKLSPALQTEIETALRQAASSQAAFSQADPAPKLTALPGLTHHRPELLIDYLTALLRPLRDQAGSTPFKGLRIVLDLAWGAAVFLAPETFRRLGAEVICLHDRPLGERINVNCGSTHLAPLQAAVLAHRADLGFAFDGDADRVLAVDHQGHPVDGDHILYLWGQQLMAQQQLPGNLMVATVMSNLGFEQAWKQIGGSLMRTAVGDQHVQRGMQQSGAMIGGEQSGHILCRHYGVTGDGLATALHLTRLVQQHGKTLAALVRQSFRPYPQRLCNVRVEDPQRRRQWQQCTELRQAIDLAESSIGHHGRILVRPSGTEPILRIMVEASTTANVEFWTEHLVGVTQRYLAA